MLADATCFCVFNVNNRSDRAFGKVYDVSQHFAQIPHRGGSKHHSFADGGRCPSLLKIDDYLYIGLASPPCTSTADIDKSWNADLIVTLNDDRCVDIDPTAQGTRCRFFERERATMYGETQLVMEDDSETRLFKFGGGVNRANNPSDAFYIGTLQDKKWMKRNIYKPLKSALDALSAAEDAYDTILLMIIDYFFVPTTEIAWKQTPHWTLMRPLSFCGVIQSGSFIIIFGGEARSPSCREAHSPWTALSDEIYILDTRSNEGWIQSPIKCPAKSRYVAVLDHRQRVHIFTSWSPCLQQQEVLDERHYNPDEIHTKGHYCIALKDILSNSD